MILTVHNLDIVANCRNERSLSMKNQSLINEVFWLRCLACLAVTLVHAIKNGNTLFLEPTFYHVGTYILNMAVLFGVPVFVFISEFLLANKYLNKVPKGFMRKRVKILLMPYLFMSIVYALFNMETWTFQEFFIKAAFAISLGESAVYFILIIFQFYFLHMLLSKYLNRLSAKIVIPIAFVINFLYLAFFNFVEAPNNYIAEYIWRFGYWLPFICWGFYFVLGFYCGKNYQAVKNMLSNKWILIIPSIALIMMLFMNKYFLIDQDSKRVDMLIYASSIIFFIMYISSRIKRVPKIVMFISNYSFSIFLLNSFFFYLLRYIDPPSILNIFSYSFYVFILTLLLCIGTAYICNQFSLGKYFVGRIMQFNVKNTQEEKHSTSQYTAVIKDSK